MLPCAHINNCRSFTYDMYMYEEPGAFCSFTLAEPPSCFFLSPLYSYFLLLCCRGTSAAVAYPTAPLPNVLYSVLLKERDPDEKAWHAKLALLLYYLMDLGVLGGTGAARASLIAGKCILHMMYRTPFCDIQTCWHRCWTA